MKELSTKDMTAYLKCIIDLESSIYCQRQARANIRAIYENERDAKKRNLIAKKNSPIKKREIEEIIKPEDPRTTRTISPVEAARINSHDTPKVLVFLGICSILMGLGMRLFFKLLLVDEISSLGTFLGTFLLVMCWGLAAVCIVCALYLVVTGNDKIKKAEAEEQRLDAEYERTMKEYEQKMKEYERLVAINEQEYENEVKQREQAIKQAELELEEAEDACKKAYEMSEEKISVPLNETRRLRDKMYGFIIFPKYRNFVAISTIYEYFASGRCTSLAGADGAYNLYEMELRQNLILDKLDTVIDQLEAIKQHQYTLYSELQKTNATIADICDNTRKIVNSVEKIEDSVQAVAHSSYITSYCAQVTAKNTEALKYIALING